MEPTLIGGHAALELLAAGHEVTLMARKPPSTPALGAMPFISGDYVLDDFSDGRLEGFDALVFAAAVDIRYLPRDGSETLKHFINAATVRVCRVLLKRLRVPAFLRSCMWGVLPPGST